METSDASGTPAALENSVRLHTPSDVYLVRGPVIEPVIGKLHDLPGVRQDQACVILILTGVAAESLLEHASSAPWLTIVDSRHPHYATLKTAMMQRDTYHTNQPAWALNLGRQVQAVTNRNLRRAIFVEEYPAEEGRHGRRLATGEPYGLPGAL